MKILSIGYIGCKLCCLAPNKTKEEFVNEYARRMQCTTEEVYELIRTQPNFYTETEISEEGWFQVYDVFED